MLTMIFNNWTTQFSQHINNQFQANVSEMVTVVTKKDPTAKRPEVIEVDSVEPGNIEIAALLMRFSCSHILLLRP